MPFGEPFDTYYKEILAPTISKADLIAIRADEINMPGVIVDQIWHGINQAKVCIADVTGRNPNVMYELGLAHAAGKPVVQIVQDV
jgi:nucleoside 2-deoxyribosyltransferase